MSDRARVTEDAATFAAEVVKVLLPLAPEGSWVRCFADTLGDGAVEIWLCSAVGYSRLNSTDGAILSPNSAASVLLHRLRRIGMPAPKEDSEASE